MKAHTIPRDFGRYLQARRRAKGMSVEEVSQQTRVTTKNLQYIESEDLAKLPSAVFVKGFLRAYSDVVAADYNEVLNRYEARCRSQAAWAMDQSQPVGGKYYYLKIFVALMILALVIAGTLYVDQYQFHSVPSEPKQEPLSTVPTATENSVSPSSEATAVESIEPAAEPAAMSMTMVPESSNSTIEPEQKAAPVRSLQKLEIQAVEPTWIKVISDGEAPREFTMQTGDRLSLEAIENFSLLVGNAGGIRILFNGETVPVIGKSGQVVTLQLP